MLRPTKPIAIVLATSVLAAGGYAAVAQGRSAQTTQQEIDLKIPKLGTHYVDTKPKGPSPGDRFLDYSKVVDAHTGGARGYEFQACDFGKVGKKMLTSCHGGLQLPAGRIAFADTGTDQGNVSRIAILGGTGAYATARGTIVIHGGSDRNIGLKVLVEP